MSATTLAESPASYGQKPSPYFTGARRLFVDHLPVNPQARLLDIGCAGGDTGQYALAQQKCGWCCGVELCAEPARAAEDKLNQVLVGNIETMDLPFAPGHFDVVLLSEVLEHLVDPWSVLRKVGPLLKPGGIIMASSPNVSHYSVLRMLLRGDWRYEKSGIMDGTHLRWFTPRTYGELFTATGFVVEFVRPCQPLRPKARLANALLLGKGTHFFTKQIFLKAVTAA